MPKEKKNVRIVWVQAGKNKEGYKQGGVQQREEFN